MECISIVDPNCLQHELTAYGHGEDPDAFGYAKHLFPRLEFVHSINFILLPRGGLYEVRISVFY